MGARYEKKPSTVQELGHMEPCEPQGLLHAAPSITGLSWFPEGNRARKTMLCEQKIKEATML